MPGYDVEFLGLPAPAPTVAVPTIQLDYLHFSVAFRPDRRLAAVTAVNIHGGLLIEIERTRDVWLLDPRVPVIEQAGPELYITTISTAAIWCAVAIRAGARRPPR